MNNKYFLLTVDVEKYLNERLGITDLKETLKLLQKFGKVNEYNSIIELTNGLGVTETAIPDEVKLIYDLINKQTANIKIENEKLQAELLKNNEAIAKVKELITTLE